MANLSPPDQGGNSNISLGKALLTMRIIWAAMLMGEVTFMLIVIFAILPGQKEPREPQPVLAWISFGMLLTVVPVTFAVRSLIFRKSRANGGLTRGAYGTGNIIFWAGCEGPCFFSLVAAIANVSIWPTILVAAVAISLQAITFPVGGMVPN